MLYITRNELKRMMDEHKDFVLIDALPAEDFEREHIPGAINISLEDADFEQALREAVPEPHRDIVVYCAGPDRARAQLAAERIEALGYMSVYQFDGGKDDWRELDTIH